jgi:integrase
MESINKREAWNKGKLVGQKPPLKPKDIWAIRIYLQNAHAVRDLAMFNLAIDSKLRGCDLVSLRVRDITHGNQVLPRAMVIQRKTQRPVQFELTEPTRTALSAWLEKSHLRSDQFLFPSRVARSPHVSTRQYARIVHHWVEADRRGDELRRGAENFDHSLLPVVLLEEHEFCPMAESLGQARRDSKSTLKSRCEEQFLLVSS